MRMVRLDGRQARRLAVTAGLGGFAGLMAVARAMSAVAPPLIGLAGLWLFGWMLVRFLMDLIGVPDSAASPKPTGSGQPGYVSGPRSAP
jgi:hypothetical protein